MTHASLFSGIGGFDLAAEWMGWSNAFNCEINPFCRKVLAYHFPNAKQYEDVKAVDFTIYRGHVDVLTGGFPCQPFSLAGKRRGTEDNRYLWGEMLRAIQQIAPRWVVGENVPGIVSWSDGMVFEQVQSDLEDAGYEVQPYIIPACAVDAPHRRDRVWFVAHRRDVENPVSDGFLREPCDGKEESDKREQRMPCTGDSEWICNEERAIATDRSHAGSEILQRERTIGVCESSILADTPCDGRGGVNRDVQSTGTSFYRTNRKGVRFGVNLSDVLASGLLPTPLATEVSHPKRIADLKAKDCRHALHGRGKSNMGEEIAETFGDGTSQNSQLSPLFVAEMMGFPIDWTLAPFLDGLKSTSDGDSVAGGEKNQ